MIEDTKSDKPRPRAGVVLVHGLTGTPVEMKPLEKALRKRGFDVENVLLAGHGGSYKDMLASTWLQWMQSARDGMNAALARNDRVILCGLSMGANICAILASEEKQVAGCIMLSPTLAYDGSVSYNQTFDSVLKSRALQHVLRYLVGRFPSVGETLYWEEAPPYGLKDERLQRQITKSIEEARKGGSNEFGTFRTYYGSLWHMWELIEHARSIFPQVTCPTLLVSSLEDTIASLDNATGTYQMIGATNKAGAYLTGCDHVMTLDLKRKLLFAMIADFCTHYLSNDPACSVREVVAPALESEHARDGVSLILSPEVCGLSESEWRSVYPDSPFAGALVEQALGGIAQHTLTARYGNGVALSLPLSLSHYSLAGPWSRRAPGRLGASLLRPLTLALGASGHVPSIGVPDHVDYRVFVESWQHALRISDSMSRAVKADMMCFHGLSTRAYQKLRANSPQSGMEFLLNDKSKTPLVKHTNPVCQLPASYLNRHYGYTPHQRIPVTQTQSEIGYA